MVWNRVHEENHSNKKEKLVSDLCWEEEDACCGSRGSRIVFAYMLLIGDLDSRNEKYYKNLHVGQDRFSEERNGYKGERELTAEGKGLTFETEKSKNKESRSMNTGGAWNIVNLYTVSSMNKQVLPFFPFFSGRTCTIVK